MSDRRYELDWLRVIAFALLIYFHAAIAFIPGGIPMIQNPETDPVMEVGVTFFHQFRLALLFLISGASATFSKRKMTNAQFIRHRTQRLLIPFLFGIVIVVPIAVYFEKRFLGAVHGSFLEFYPQFFTAGIYPSGNLSWHHLWFIVYLYLYCLLGVLIFDRLDRVSEKIILAGLKTYPRLAVYAPVLPLVMVEISLRAFFPGFRDLIHDWASFSQWFLFFLAGYIVARHLALLNIAVTCRRHSLLFGLATTVMLFYLFRQPTGELTPVKNGAVSVSGYIGFAILRAANAWLWVLVCLGYAGRYLRFSRPLLGYLNQAVYPFFVLHLTVIVMVSYWIVRLELNLWLKYFAVVSITTITLLMTYHFLIRPFALMRVLTGAERYLSPWELKLRETGKDD